MATARKPRSSRAPLHRRRGVSLVEALVAMAVMAIGMLALVGVQTTMRFNSDLAKQRTEATRIASEEVERLRSFSLMVTDPLQPGQAYDDIASRTLEAYTPPDNIGNTSYRVVRTVVDMAPATNQKVVSVQVQWEDRTERAQTVTVDSVIAGAAPTLSALLTVPARESATSRRKGRHTSIPWGATPVDGNDGESQFVPPGATGIAWYFNNLTGVMRVCPTGVPDDESCAPATLVTGTVRYHVSDVQPTGADAERPTGPSFNLAAGPDAMALADATGVRSTDPISCFSGLLPTSELNAGVLVQYFCAVFPATASPGWGGQISPTPIDATSTPLALTGLASTYKVCRYTGDLPTAEDAATPAVTEADPHAQYTRNTDHPLKYCLERPRNPTETGLACTGKLVAVNLIHQNFLVIKGDLNCPTELNDDGTANGQGTDALILANTRQHQPAP